MANNAPSDIKQVFSNIKSKIQTPNLEKEQKAAMKREASKQARSGRCDPVYKQLIENMLLEHRNDPMRSALVFVNSFDYTKEDIEDFMEEKRIYAEVFEIDRMQQDQRFEYLNCIGSLYGSKSLPAIFMKDKFVGGLAEAQKFDMDSYMNEMKAQKIETEQV